MILTSSLHDIPAFRSPSWCMNGHVHTIACSFLDGVHPPYQKRVEITTPDDDFLEIDVIDQENDNPVIALFHGLEGSTERYYMTELAADLKEVGFSVAALNFRSCGSRLNRQPRFYHSGETKDYATFFKWIQKTFPGKKIGAAGFSLGANALLKSLGEEMDRHPADAAVAVSVPYDLRLGSINLSQGFNRVYDYRFLRTLRRKLDEKRRQYPDLPRFTGSTLYDFDDQVTSKVHGFADAEDYYARCSARKFVSDIRKPALLIHSDQDPLCPISGMPVDKIRENPVLDYVITDEGGHVGFRSEPRGWLNYVIIEYLHKVL
ncbi:alpha/beta fold hydrolase [Balneolaceae bacterium YR4-1]|uniref:Alpha/beta fold hydrolase n=1 Tax=Halalkalibaculum roseum TaxID=2709311 RepID=A0A6M1SR61_9BACT|nr:alpha/beta fold hydrolase [Halalkalibaculum roseum]NGP75300.1 alpha/beta fold hydrolase [Halalkalibaculum roseum]